MDLIPVVVCVVSLPITSGSTRTGTSTFLSITVSPSADPKVLKVSVEVDATTSFTESESFADNSVVPWLKIKVLSVAANFPDTLLSVTDSKTEDVTLGSDVVLEIFPSGMFNKGSFVGSTVRSCSTSTAASV